MKGLRTFGILISVFVGLIVLISLFEKRQYNWEPTFSATDDEPFGCKLFSRTVTLENNIRMLDYAMRDYISDPAELADTRYGEVVSYTTDESVLFFLFKRHACHTSAEIICNDTTK